MQSIVNAVFLFLHFYFRRSAYIEDSYAAGHFSQTFLKFFLIVVRGRIFHLDLDLTDTGLDGFLVAGTVYDGCIVFVDNNLLSSTQHIHRSAFQLQTFFFRDDRTARQYGDIFQHGLTTIAEARSFYGTDLQRTTQTVNDQGSQGFAIDIFSDNQQRTTALNCRFQDRQQVFQDRNLLVVDQYIWIFHLAFHLFRIGYEVRRDIATVELHTFHDVNRCFSTFGFFNGDNAFFLHFLHGFCNQFTDRFVAVGRNLGYVFNLFEFVAYFFSLFCDVGNNFGNGFVDTAFQIHRVCTGSHVLQTYADNRLSQNGGCRRTVAGIVVCLGSDFLNQLGTHVFKRVGQFDFLGYRYTIFRDVRSAEFLFDNHVTTFRAEGYLHGICQFVHAFLQQVAGIHIIFNYFCHSAYSI